MYDRNFILPEICKPYLPLFWVSLYYLMGYFGVFIQTTNLKAQPNPSISMKKQCLMIISITSHSTYNYFQKGGS